MDFDFCASGVAEIRLKDMQVKSLNGGKYICLSPFDSLLVSLVLGLILGTFLFSSYAFNL